jgi:hypothetical protein
LAGPKRNFLVFDPLDFLAEVNQHIMCVAIVHKKALVSTLIGVLFVLCLATVFYLIHEGDNAIATRLQQREQTHPITEKVLKILGCESLEELYQRRKTAALKAAEDLPRSKLTKVLPYIVRCLSETNYIIAEAQLKP